MSADEEVALKERMKELELRRVARQKMLDDQWEQHKESDAYYRTMEERNRQFEEWSFQAIQATRQELDGALEAEREAAERKRQELLILSPEAAKAAELRREERAEKIARLEVSEPRRILELRSPPRIHGHTS